MRKRDLVIGFSGEEKERITTHLGKLFPHLKPNGFVIVGGLAIRYHLLSSNIPYPQRPFNDVDIIVKNPKVVSPSVSKDFFIYHYHPKDYFLALIDPISRTKVDIFSYYPAPKETVRVLFEDKEVDIVSIEDQLVKTVLDIQRISPKAKVDLKQFSDTKLLMQITDMRKADKIWRFHNSTQYPKSITQAIEKAEKIVEEHPEWLQEKPFRKQKPYVCPNCYGADGFDISPMEEVYEVLGYVE